MWWSNKFVKHMVCMSSYWCTIMNANLWRVAMCACLFFFFTVSHECLPLSAVFRLGPLEPSPADPSHGAWLMSQGSITTSHTARTRRKGRRSNVHEGLITLLLPSDDFSKSGSLATGGGAPSQNVAIYRLFQVRYWSSCCNSKEKAIVHFEKNI